MATITTAYFKVTLIVKPMKGKGRKIITGYSRSQDMDRVGPFIRLTDRSGRYIRFHHQDSVLEVSIEYAAMDEANAAADT